MTHSELHDLDPEAFELLAAEEKRQMETIDLIASENFVSQSVMYALGSVFSNKYSEGTIGKRYYAGNSVIDAVEQLAVSRAKALFGAEHINVQPLSGAPANIAIYMATLKPGDTVLGMALDHGGHLSHGHPLNFSGLQYNFVPYTVNKESGVLDMDEVAQLAREARPKMIVAGFSSYSRTLDWQRFRQIADEVGAILFADISHIAGLIAGGVLENPVPLCDIVMTTTHKTLRGPRGAMIMCKERFAKDIDRAVFPGVQGGPHNNSIFAKAVAFGEALTPTFKEYSLAVVENSQVLARTLSEIGFTIVFGGTDNNIVLVDMMESRGLSGGYVSAILERVGIITNKNVIPFDSRSPFDPSGVRLGTPAMTTRGAGSADIKEIVGLIDAAITYREDEQETQVLADAVRKLALRLPPPGI